MQKRILVIDDELGFTRLLKMGLERFGRYQVAVSHGSNGAMAMALKFNPDVILLDVMMPGLDGGDLAARFAAHPKLKEIPIVFLTAAVRKEELAKNQGRIGGSPFVSKPVDIRQLLEVIEGSLSSTTSTRE